MMQEGSRDPWMGVHSSSQEPEGSQVSQGGPSYDQLSAENVELKKKLQQERGMRQRYAKKLEEAEEEWLEQVEQLQSYVKSIRYSMADNHSHSIPTFGKSENGQSSSESGGNRAAHQGLPGSSGNGQNHRERRQQVVRDLKGTFEAKMHVMGDDATFIQEVTEGVSQAPEMDPEHELQELAKKFRIWKHDFKEKLKATAELLRKMSKDPHSSHGRASRGTVRSSQRGRSPGSPSSNDTMGSDPDVMEKKKDMDKSRPGFVRRFLSIGKASQ